MNGLAGKVALVTGAARGIGASAARVFAREGARLMLVDVADGPLRDLACELGDAAAYVAADVTDEADMKAAVARTIGLYGRVDVAVLNAGIVGEFRSIQDYSTEVFENVMAVNVRGVFLGLKYAMRAMEKSGGSIIVTSSAAGIRATPNVVAYNASKHATIGLMRSAAVEGAARNIRVNTVNPALTDTPLMAALNATKVSRPESESSIPLSHMIPMGRAGTPEEVARLMLFLASEDASFCTGGVYVVDGGVSAGRAF